MYKKRPALFILTTTSILAFFYFLYGVNSWKFSYVGDEWFFYRFAKELAFRQKIPYPFSFNGVFETHSILVSLYQAMFIRVLGATNFAWRLSNIILIFPLTVFSYYWIKESYGSRAAVFGTILLQCSFYLANFFKIGYDNPQALTLFVASLFWASAYGKHPSVRYAFILGVTLGISFYIYIGPLFPLFVWPYLLPLLKAKNRKHTLQSVVYLVGGYVFMLLPVLMNLYFAVDGPYKSVAPLDSRHIRMNILSNLMLFFHNSDYFNNHFVAGPYLDILSRLLCVMGMAAALVRRKRANLLLIMSYIATAVILGIMSPYKWTPATRGIFLLPFGFVFAGLGLDVVFNYVRKHTSGYAYCGVILLSIFLINAYQSQFGVFTDKKGGYTGTALILKTLEETPQSERTVIVLSKNLTLNKYIWELPTLLQAYNLRKDYSIVTPESLDCTFNKAHYLVLAYDEFARLRLDSLNCGPLSRMTFTILNPRITNF